MSRKAMVLLVIGVVLLGASGGVAFLLFKPQSRERWPTDSFHLVIFCGDEQDRTGHFRLGRTYGEAFPKLKSSGAEAAFFVIGMDQIETYDWDTQSITLTLEATKGLAALEPPEVLKNEVREMPLRERLVWATSEKGFLALVGEEPIYGGIFVDPMSQRSIDFPVLRVSLTPDKKARLNLLPIHVPFFMQDPASGETLAPEMRHDWQQFSQETKQLVGSYGDTQTAKDFRKVIRNNSVREIMQKSGKIREQA